MPAEPLSPEKENKSVHPRVSTSIGVDFHRLLHNYATLCGAQSQACEGFFALEGGGEGGATVTIVPSPRPPVGPVTLKPLVHHEYGVHLVIRRIICVVKVCSNNLRESRYKR